MRLSKRVKSISYLKANTAEIIRELNNGEEPLIVTQNGEAKVIVQDLAEYERMQEDFALMKILSMGRENAQKGKSMTVAESRKKLRRRHDA
ncbi:MAG: type II toxin-antitoxin system Phd/YefM family antitoxin [Planctomycetota bacterium]